MAKKRGGPGAPGDGAGSVMDAFNEWLQHVRNRDVACVTVLYDEPTFFFGTISPGLRTGHDQVKAYFEHFLLTREHVDVVAVNPEVRVLGTGDDAVALNAGHYIFFFEDKEKRMTSVTARYTFVYRKVDGTWKIVEHHSSAMPG